ncbi:MAG: SGNH/GDSL hydrolase family protein [Lachnospiraceae bacterium]|nr:SGNH/GDSL hydrolase family protein [Lachnospiraceae bacterium]
MSKLTKRIIFIMSTLFVILLFLLAYFYLSRVHFTTDILRRNDVEALEIQDYNCILMSMTPPTNIDTYVLDELMGYDTLQATHRFENLFDISDYLTLAFSKAPDTAMIYIVVSPSELASDYGYHASIYGKLIDKKLGEFCGAFPETEFYFLLSPLSAEYLHSLNSKKQTEILASYRDFYNVLAAYENVRVSYYNDTEWVISNPAGFETEETPTRDLYRLMMALGFYDGKYLLKYENSDMRFSLTEQLISSFSGYEKYHTLDNTELIFFGDSVIGNFSDSTSIPEVASALLDVPAYNIGLGGASAGTGMFEKIADDFISGNYEAYDNTKQPRHGIKDFVDKADSESDKIFIITFALNDFFSGTPVEAYAESMRKEIEVLMSSFPNSRVIILSTTFTQAFGYGNEIQNDGGTLNDYVTAAQALCDDFPDGSVIWTDYGFDINRENFSQYLSDGVHPNEYGRFLIGRHIAELLSSQGQ